MPVQKRVAGLVVQSEKAVREELYREELQEKVDVYMGAADPL